MADYQQKKEVDKRLNMPVDFAQLTMWAPTPGVDGKSAMGTWEMTGASNDQIQFRVLTNDPVDKEGRDRGVIRAVFPNLEFEIFLTFLGEAIRSKGPYKRCIDGLSWWGKDGRLNEPRSEFELFVGKDEAGAMYIALTKYKRPKIVFGFAPTRKNYRFKREDGTVMSDAEESILYANAQLRLLSRLPELHNTNRLVRALNPDAYKPPYVPKPQNSNGGNGGGGSSYSNNNGGNNQSSGGSTGGAQASNAAAYVSNDDDDDIPY